MHPVRQHLRCGRVLGQHARDDRTRGGAGHECHAGQHRSPGPLSRGSALRDQGGRRSGGRAQRQPLGGAADQQPARAGREGEAERGERGHHHAGPQHRPGSERVRCLPEKQQRRGADQRESRVDQRHRQIAEPEGVLIARIQRSGQVRPGREHHQQVHRSAPLAPATAAPAHDPVAGRPGTTIVEDLPQQHTTRVGLTNAEEKQTFLHETVQNKDMIDPKLRVLQLVAHHGTVTAAAQALHYTPSAVSHQLRQLSAELGVELMIQSGRGIRLTAAAATVLRHAEVLQAQAERARAELAATADEPGGSFTLCGFSTAATHLLPPAAATLRDHYPQLSVRVIEAEPARCFDLLLAGDADLALLIATSETPPASDTRFDQHPLLDDPLDLVVPSEQLMRLRYNPFIDFLLDKTAAFTRPSTDKP